MEPVRGRPYARTPGARSERWYQTLTHVHRANAPLARFLILRTLSEHHFPPGALKAAIGAFVDHHTHRRVHESLGNVTPDRRLFRPSRRHHRPEKEIKGRNHMTAPLAQPG